MTARLPVRTILVPTDFSECSRRALDQATELAESLQAELVLLHASELPPGLPRNALIRVEGRDWPVEEYLEDTAAKQLGVLVGDLKRRGLRVGYRAETGGSVSVILDVARTVDADLIVLGTHGRRGIRRALLGSVAERVVRHSPVPVLAVRMAGDTDELPQAEGDLRAELDG